MSRDYSLPRLIVDWTLLSMADWRAARTPRSHRRLRLRQSPQGDGATRTGRLVTTGWSKGGPSRCRTLATRTTDGRGDPLAASTRKIPTESGSPCVASCRCRRAPLRGHPTRRWERRFQHSIIVFDRQGNLVDEWPHLDELFSKNPCGRGPHQIKISPYDKQKHVWIIDDQLHMIYRFTYDGKLVHSKGQLGVRGRGPNTFDRPTDIAWLPEGTYFITDGYGGTRVVKYDANDNFIMDWGQPPKDPRNPGPNEWNTVHSIAISADRRLFVVDRGHARMQVFDENGKFLDMWPLKSPHWPANQPTLFVNHFIDDKGFIWVGDAPSSRILKFDLNGNFLYSWGAPGSQPGRLNCSHGITTDQLGNLYLADCFAGRLQKFEPIPGADPDKIAGQILRTWDTWKGP